MEGKQQVILFLLLVTLSSVIGLDFSFSKEAYDAFINTHQNNGLSLVDAEKITFFNMDDEEHWAELLDDRNEDLGSVNLKPVIPEIVKTGISGVRNHGEEPELLSFMSIGFTEISTETTYGNLILCFLNPKNDSRKTCMITLMFSPAKTREDDAYAKEIGVELDPLSAELVKKLSSGTHLKWKLSSLKKILSNDIKAIEKSRKFEILPSSSMGVRYLFDKGTSAFLLKPIIVGEHLLEEYYELA